MVAWRSLPPLAALRAFAAFAETGSVVRAGEALNVSHAAISQQLRALEAHLGLALIARQGRELALTAEGRLLAEAATTGFDGIARVVELLTGAEAGRPLQITTTPSFASGWLMPRLADFRARHPEVDLTIDPSGTLQPLGPGGHDIALRFGSGGWPGVEAELLIRSGVVVVASPALVGDAPVGDIADLAGHPWMQELGTNEASAFLERHGVARGAGGGLTSLPGNLMIDAARDGQGIAVIARAFVEADLAAGRLRLLHQDDSCTGYYLVTPKGVLRPAARAFVRWALRQARTGTGAR
jgi:LysR family transcriptional regulator, glycine cleavage system transcriptional activator